jgi:hypothetical protein
MRPLGLLAALAAAGCSHHTPDGAPLSLAQEIVRKHILDSAADPASVTFDGWGPDDTRGEVRDAERKALAAPGPPAVTPAGYLLGRADQIVRVRFRDAKGRGGYRVADELYCLERGKLIGNVPNQWGDGWLEEVKVLVGGGK